jgi:DNA-binding transcriptional ArsR family regulator
MAAGARLMFHETLSSLRGEDMRVELDKKSLFALASDTRLDILRALQPMRRTVSQLSEALDIDKAAIHRHLKKMEEGGLVKRFEDHGFVYYGLSWKARDLLSPNDNTKIVILLSASWILCLAIVFLFVLGTTSNGTVLSPSEHETGEGPSSDTSWYWRDLTGNSTFGPQSVLWVIPSIVLSCAAVVMVVVGVRTHLKPKQKALSAVTRPDAPKT